MWILYILEESKIYESHNFEILLWKIVDILNNNRGRIMFCRNDVLYVKFLKKKEKKEKKENWLHSFQIVQSKKKKNILNPQEIYYLASK